MRRTAALLLLGLLLPLTAPAQRVAKPNAILLVAKPGLLDPNFRQTVVLVTQAPDQHTVGVVLNRPTENKYDRTGETLYYGGPVMRQVIVAMFQTDRPTEAAFHVLRGIYLSMHPADLETALSRRGPRLRLYSGFSGWAPGQLENEMRGESWDVLPATEALLFQADTSGMWKELSEKAQRARGPRAQGLEHPRAVAILAP